MKHSRTMCVAFALALTIGATATSAQQVCMTEVGACEHGCDLDFAAGALWCSSKGFTPQAAICHAGNAAAYGACLAGCR